MEFLIYDPGMEKTSKDESEEESGDVISENELSGESPVEETGVGWVPEKAVRMSERGGR